ncbi:MAG: hypothetical protein HY252_00130 [Sphingobacteriales bacterium]|nr:hypothetical protein [Sphingobacteriales bacterium]
MPITRNASVLLISALLFSSFCNAQMITGVWKGKISGNGSLLKSQYKLELKLVQKGDSLTGTSYYYASSNNYYRFKVKGYFNSDNSTVVWWDEEMIEYSTNNKLLAPNDDAMINEADFNCPGGGKMMLDGTAKKKEDDKEFTLHLDKTDGSNFKDEWDWLIDNYTYGANDPYIIDSVCNIATASVSEKEVEQPVTINKPVEEKKPVIKTAPSAPKKEAITKKEPIVIAPVKKDTVPVLTIEEKFLKREKKITTEIPLVGDSVELRFYDNAEIDGDSISLFLNDRLIFEHIKLTDQPYTIKLAVKDLNDNNELAMVAENLGAIPPNTSYMLAIVNNQRYEAVLTSTEGSSAVIRFRKKSP